MDDTVMCTDCFWRGTVDQLDEEFEGGSPVWHCPECEGTHIEAGDDE